MPSHATRKLLSTPFLADLTGAPVAMVDFVERLYMKRTAEDAPLSQSEERHQVFASRIITVLVGIIGIVIALQVSRLGSLLQISNKLINSFTGPILGIYLLGMFTRRATSGGVLAGGAVGTLVTIYFAFQAEIHKALGVLLGAEPGANVVVSFLWPSTFGFAATVAVGYACSLLTPYAAEHSGAAWIWSKVVQSKSQQ